MPGATAESISWMTLITFTGGLALFLYGIERMTAELKLLAGDRLRSSLLAFTSNRFFGMLSGGLLTAVIQSSSVTTVLAVSFVASGLMTLRQAIPVMLGASVGTTVTAQIIALKITDSALALISVGFVVQLISSQATWKRVGGTVLGLGLLFLGMNVMSGAVAPLRQHPVAIQLLQHLDSPWLAVLASAGFTAIIQSSSATAGLILVLVGQNLLTLPQAIPLILGANIGTCATALLSTIGKPRSALRTAASHLLIQVLGGGLWFALQAYLPWVVGWITSDPVRQVAHSHTLINTLQALLFLGLVTPIVKLAEWLMPDLPKPPTEIAQPKYLDPVLLGTPALALNAARMEICRLGISALQMVRAALATVLHGDSDELDRLQALDDDVDALHAAIITYLGRLSQRAPLSDKESRQLYDSLLMANYLENIGDMIESNLVPAGRRRLRANLVVSQGTSERLDRLHRDVSWALERAVRGLADQDLAVVREVVDYKASIQSSVASVERQLAQRLAAEADLRLTAYRLESEILEHLKRIYYFVKRIAHTLIDQSKAAGTAPSQESPQNSTNSAADSPNHGHSQAT